MILADYIWYFFIYSFLGFVVEVLFARVIHNPKRDRKCLYFLPLCPMYGLGALFILWLPAGEKATPLLLFFFGGLAATAAEFLTGIFYEKVAKVRFWDYSHLPLNIGGQVCLLFTAMWGLLSLALVYGVHPHVVRLVAAIPPAWLVPGVLFFLADVWLTLHLLRRERSTEVLRWYKHLGRRAKPEDALGDTGHS